MMNTIVDEKLVSFKEMEQKVYRFACGIAREMTRDILENYDNELAEGRDKKEYRNKGKRKTSIKTVYGEVEYSRRVYQTVLKDGTKAYVYLLDEAMGMDRIGLISTNFAEQIALAVTDAPYRKGAALVSSTTGGSISAAGTWNLVQKLGSRICDEEELDVRRMESGVPEGKKEVSLLFEEMDGVWLKMQDRHHKKAHGEEMKVFTMYEAWDAEKEKEGRSTLVNKKILAGMEDSGPFHRKKEAYIEKIYDPYEIGQRVLNGDGGSWIYEPYDEDAVFQLDPYHVQEAITRWIYDKAACREIRKLLRAREIDKSLEYIKAYADSVASDDPEDTREKNAMILYRYLSNNRRGLLPWQKQLEEVPKPPEGCLYKNMGVQENQNCTVITQRMKHRRMRWSKAGANNMGKALARRANGELQDTISRYTDGLVMNVSLTEILSPLSAAKAPKKDGKGNPYADVISCHLPLLDAIQTAARKALSRAMLGEGE